MNKVIKYEVAGELFETEHEARLYEATLEIVGVEAVMNHHGLTLREYIKRFPRLTKALAEAIVLYAQSQLDKEGEE